MKRSREIMVTCLIILMLQALTYASMEDRPQAPVLSQRAWLPESAGEAARVVKIGIVPLADASGRGGDAGSIIARYIRSDLLRNEHYYPKIVQYKPEQGEAGGIDMEKAVELGSRQGLEYVIIGTILDAETRRGSTGLGGFYVNGHWVSANTRRVTASITMEVELVSVKAGRTVEAFRVTGNKTAVALDADIYTNWGTLRTDGQIDERSPLIGALRDAAKQIIDKVSSKIGAIEKIS
jgi:hypothetical protein